jgi:transcription initiation factor TFIID subunit 2
MEYLAEIHFHQPVQMWINQLEKDKDVISQSQAISVLEKLPQLSSAVINALNNFLNDTKAFWRVRVEAAYALAVTASEAIPHAVALVRSSDKNSPKGAIEFILQLLKYNDNNGNIYSDVYWLSAMVQSIGELELGQQVCMDAYHLIKYDLYLILDAF